MRTMLHFVSEGNAAFAYSWLSFACRRDPLVLNTTFASGYTYPMAPNDPDGDAAGLHTPASDELKRPVATSYVSARQEAMAKVPAVSWAGREEPL